MAFPEQLRSFCPIVWLPGSSEPKEAFRNCRISDGCPLQGFLLFIQLNYINFCQIHIFCMEKAEKKKKKKESPESLRAKDAAMTPIFCCSSSEAASVARFEFIQESQLQPKVKLLASPSCPVHLMQILVFKKSVFRGRDLISSQRVERRDP